MRIVFTLILVTNTYFYLGIICKGNTPFTISSFKWMVASEDNLQHGVFISYGYSRQWKTANWFLWYYHWGVMRWWDDQKNNIMFTSDERLCPLLRQCGHCQWFLRLREMRIWSVISHMRRAFYFVWFWCHLIRNFSVSTNPSFVVYVQKYECDEHVLFTKYENSHLNIYELGFAYVNIVSYRR
jgi:hypothetical protein